jgi:hypothetical protein
MSLITIHINKYSCPLFTFQSLSLIVSFYINGLDIYAGYQVNQLQHSNTKLLIERKIIMVIICYEDVFDFLVVVILVWRRISEL